MLFIIREGFRKWMFKFLKEIRYTFTTIRNSKLKSITITNSIENVICWMFSDFFIVSLKYIFIS
ncbi:hypothetical protein GLOIN_2v1669560 [Rhizophagus irregularis DAOM 181602=DAOM 197198]|uniref:Uncharacterized protein n=1 Tax=Rhizophagus irregularis (strain DAOM 181602 / DAOM 197198 / MUCL 43194) TaxID=747089 RepID=A0A2P4PIA7_RHIID|nr:hypothetical protein GLOIN_2v1669560 [Rhizophagus irregularis DAOM 181602=DAOM 197198]POG65136.1 hypothetical protein GLOIN_2v1669560 [Rhizophagus irregularis DAOM 181602=DAOM 197198]|eukprot:XP_025172002.1 hypothetical protein GLOIN_2v1669560 [Rhizophagus irregularis DAOM 181602=DAOM 197198]